MALTGRKVFIITASAFGVIIGVNLTMAYLAVGSFPGLEVKNSYVASQSFDADRAAQEALGWKVAAGVDGRAMLRIAFTGRSGLPVEVKPRWTATVGRPTHVRDDIEPDFSYADAAPFTAPVDLGPGRWDIRMVATAPDGTAFRQRIALNVD